MYLTFTFLGSQQRSNNTINGNTRQNIWDQMTLLNQITLCNNLNVKNNSGAPKLIAAVAFMLDEQSYKAFVFL